MSSISESSFQDIASPSGVGLVSTEGEKLLNALRKIQTKLHQKQHKSGDRQEMKHLDHKKTSKDMSYTHYSSGDHNCGHKMDFKCGQTSDCRHQTEDNNKLIETRLKLIETQLENISIQLMANNSVKHEMNGQKRVDSTSQSNGFQTITHKPSPLRVRFEDQYKSDDKYQKSINNLKEIILSSDRLPKQMSNNTINYRSNPSKHFRLQYNDIPFLLASNSSKSHSVIANRQIEISRLKQHNHLCTDQIPVRKIFSETVRTKLLDSEIKELLYDLHEEHNYICEEIQDLSKHLETITDPNRRQEFNRDLYFLSRRILAKKKQINELQELHQILNKNSIQCHSDTNSKSSKPVVRHQIRNKANVKRCLSNECIPKWI